MRAEIVALLPELGRFASSLTKNWTKSEDLLQDTLVRALTAEGSFTPGTNLRAWLFTIMRNTHINNQRPSVNFTIPHAPDDGVFRRAYASDARDARDELMHVAKRFGALPDWAQQMISAAIETDTSCHKMAEQMHMKVGTVKSRLHRARSELRRA